MTGKGSDRDDVAILSTCGVPSPSDPNTPSGHGDGGALLAGGEST